MSFECIRSMLRRTPSRLFSAMTVPPHFRFVRLPSRSPPPLPRKGGNPVSYRGPEPSSIEFSRTEEEEEEEGRKEEEEEEEEEESREESCRNLLYSSTPFFFVTS